MFHGYQHILCTVDPDNIPQGYLKEAARLASCFESKLIFVTALPKWKDSGKTEPASAIGSDKPYATQAIGTVQCSVVNELGPVGEVVKRIAERRRVDLVLTNRGHLQHPFGKFRTHAYEIVLESPCPVLSVCMHAESEHHARIEAPSETLATRHT